ncbi:MAG: hypothetical protein KGM43_05260 [Planctomycetota bacterium]|nr:hypothetical protein [Planctomycetota bacterium]
MDYAGHRDLTGQSAVAPLDDGDIKRAIEAHRLFHLDAAETERLESFQRRVQGTPRPLLSARVIWTHPDWVALLGLSHAAAQR